MAAVQRDIATIEIPKAHICASSSLFVSSFAVYEVRFTLTNPTETCSVTRRYRQFRDLYTSVAAPQLPSFPTKRYFERLKASVIEERRVQLQVWLLAVSRLPSLHIILGSFLGVTLAARSPGQFCYYTQEEKAVLDCIASVDSNPRTKLSSLLSLDQSLFARQATLRGDFLRKLLEFLVLLSADHIAGCKAISVLHKLTSRGHYRVADTVVQEWLSLGPEKIRCMGLDLHLLGQMSGDTRREAFDLFKIVHGAWIVAGRTFLLSLVSARQLNDNLEAFRLFERWLDGKLLVGEQETPTRRLGWQVLTNGSNGDLAVKYKLVEEGIQIKARIRIHAPWERLQKCILHPEERVKWDHRVHFAELREGDFCTRGVMEYTHEISGAAALFVSDFRVVRNLPESVKIEFFRKNFDSVLSYYSILPDDKNANRLQKNSLFEASDSFSDEEKDNNASCLLKYSAKLTKELGKMILPDLLGESEDFQRSFENLKRLAERDTLSPLRAASFLTTAIERKSLTPKARKHGKKCSRMTTILETRSEQKVARKMIF